MYFNFHDASSHKTSRVRLAHPSWMLLSRVGVLSVVVGIVTALCVYATLDVSELSAEAASVRSLGHKRRTFFLLTEAQKKFPSPGPGRYFIC